MDIINEKRGCGTLLQVIGRMDAMSAPAFENQCLQVIEDGETTVVVDLSGLEYISSAGIRSILASAKKAKGTGCTIRVCGLGGMVQEVFQVSGLSSIFAVAASADEAFAS